jgi:uroporphyrinogen decarboxylase
MQAIDNQRITNYKRPSFVQVLHGQQTETTPVWVMRQAGRYLPEYMVLRRKYSFFERCQTPELATEITMQPLRRFALDAAILFSDILVVPQAMGVEVLLEENIGPVLPNPIRTMADLKRVHIPDVSDALHYVAQAIDLTKVALNNLVPLIGFAGSPWTIFCYMTEGKGSKTFDKAKAICFSNPELATKLLDKITETTIAYLKMKARHGVDALQIFDSWGGLLSPEDYQTWSLPYIQRIINAVKLEYNIPIIVFAKGASYALPELAATGATALGLDWTCSPQFARQMTQEKVVLQGNLDPALLLASPQVLEQRVKTMVSGFKRGQYIANLGHGITPNIAVEQVQRFIDTVKSC